jgi:hypothetical protein
MQKNLRLALAGLWCLWLTACRAPNKTTWSARSLSPDNGWLALAHSEHTNVGFGADAQWTIVEMKQNIPNGAPLEVLQFDEGPDSVHELEMNWPTPNHLDITYRGNAPITFQAIKAFGKDVTVEQLPQN